MIVEGEDWKEEPQKYPPRRSSIFLPWVVLNEWGRQRATVGCHTLAHSPCEACVSDGLNGSSMYLHGGAIFVCVYMCAHEFTWMDHQLTCTFHAIYLERDTWIYPYTLLKGLAQQFLTLCTTILEMEREYGSSTYSKYFANFQTEPSKRL